VNRADAASTLGALPGVMSVETQRVAPARFSRAHRSRDGALVGYGAAPRLRRLLAYPFHEMSVPADGVVLTDALARLIGVRAGDGVDVEALFGRHARGTLRVTGVVAEPVGLFGHLSLQALGRLLAEQDLVDHAYLAVSDGPRAMDALAEVPGVLAASQKDVVRALFRAQTGNTRQIFVVIATSFGCALAVGIVYNNARIALSRRARELASLRVLGFTRREVASMVAIELAVQVVLGIPFGLWLGRAMSAAIMSTVSEEMWRFPITVVPRTHAFAIAVVLASTACCLVLVRRHVARLDLVGVLKTRE
jgi:putative ABC transport system permease protein